VTNTCLIFCCILTVKFLFFLLLFLLLLITTEIHGFNACGDNSRGCQENFATRVKVFGVM
jgi:hypothetical protein